MNSSNQGKESTGSFSLRDRCASPLVLMNNNKPPPFSSSSSSGNNQAKPTPNDRNAYGKAPQPSNGPNFNQLPKRTVSLGPRRPAPLPLSGISEGERKLNDIASDLQSSLTELNNIIDMATPKITTNKPPRFTASSFADSSAASSGAISRGQSPPSPPRLIQTWNVEEDLHNWKSRGSMNDLRSMFEKQSNKQQDNKLLTASNVGQRPPRSASPNFLKNSPWHNMTLQNNTNSGSTLPRPPGATKTTGGDYTIRRTISTSSGRLASNEAIRNPYRTQY